MSKRKDLSNLSNEELIEKVIETENRFAESYVNAAIMISEVQEKNEELQNLSQIATSSFNEIFIFSQENFKFLYCNKAALTNLGYTLEEMYRLHPWDLKRHLNRESFEGKIAQLIHEEARNISLNSVHTRKDGTTYPVDIRLQKGTYQGIPVYTAIILDIGKEIELREQLHLASKLASVGELAAGVGHEINNPLTIILGHLNKVEKLLGKTNSISKEAKSSIKKCEIAGNRIKKIVQGLRTYARSDEKDLESFDVLDSVFETVSLVQEIYSKEGIQIKVQNRTNPSESTFIYGNKGRIQQVIMNLISNAKDAVLKVQKPQILVNIATNSQGIEVEVRDNGHGISPKNQNKVFSSFFTTKDINQGTGIGLSLVASITHEHKGFVTFDTVPGKGTSFKLKLPTVDNTQFQTKDSPERSEKKQLDLNILFAEDDSEVRELLTDQLKELGFKVTVKNDGKALVEAFFNNPTYYDLIITDMKMPVMNGEKAVTIIRNSKYSFQPKIIAITGGIEADLADSNNSFTHLIDGYILKPFDRDLLEKTIADVFTKEDCKKSA